jgi:hypothetical protein
VTPAADSASGATDAVTAAADPVVAPLTDTIGTATDAVTADPTEVAATTVDGVAGTAATASASISDATQAVFDTAGNVSGNAATGLTDQAAVLPQAMIGSGDSGLDPTPGASGLPATADLFTAPAHVPESDVGGVSAAMDVSAAATGSDHAPASGAAADFLTGVADAPRVELLAVAHVLSVPEARLGLLSLLGLLSVSRAYGLGMVETVQPVVETASMALKMTFRPMRLVPCPSAAGAAASGTASVTQDAGIDDAAQEQHSSRRHTREHRLNGNSIVPAGISGNALDGLKPWADRGSEFVMRLVACFLATLSALAAAAGALRHARSRPPRRRYL